MYSASHLFCVLSLSHLILFDALPVSCLGSDPVSTLRPLRLLRPCLNIRIVSQHSDRVSNHVSIQATSRNQLCLTRIEIENRWRNKMYIEGEDILYSVELRDQSPIRSVTFNPFIDEISALPFDIADQVY